MLLTPMTAMSMPLVKTLWVLSSVLVKLVIQETEKPVMVRSQSIPRHAVTPTEIFEQQF